MRFRTIVTALALVAACCCANNVGQTFGQEDADATKAEAKPFDFTVFDVPEGKDEAFYAAAFDKIYASLNENAPSDAAESEKVFEKLGPAMKTIYKGLADATAEETVEKCNNAFQIYLSATLQFKENLDEVKAAFAAEKAAGKSKDRVSMAFYFVFIGSLNQGELTDDAFKALADELLANANDLDPALVARVTQTLMSVKPELAKDLVAQVVKLFRSSEDAMKKAIANSLEGGLRFAALPGNEMKMEGLYLDGKEIDWKSYRGKVVLVDFWATWCGPCLAEIPNVLALYEKYHEAGFDVLGYSVDQDLDALKKFEEERKLPWKTASAKMSVEAKENGGKEYVDISDYYGVNAIPTMVLVGKDGKVISVQARGQILKDLLQKEFPDVE